MSSAADEWGAEFAPHGAGGSLRLPVLHGLRRGLVEGSVRIEAADGGARVEVLQVSCAESLNVPALCLLLLAAAGAVVSAIWPLYPRLLPLVPIGMLLAFAGWFQVSRPQKRSPADFLRRIEAHAQAEPGPGTGPAAGGISPPAGAI